MAEENYSIEIQNEPALAVVTLEGALDMAGIQSFQAMFDKVFQSGCFSVVLDFSKVPSLLSAHLGILYQRQQIARQRGGNIAVCGANELVAKAFRRVGFDKVLSLLPSMEAAREFLVSGKA